MTSSIYLYDKAIKTEFFASKLNPARPVLSVSIGDDESQITLFVTQPQIESLISTLQTYLHDYQSTFADELCK